MSINLDLSSTTLHPPEPVNVSRRPFLTPLPTPGHFLLVIDNTGLEKIKRCHMAARNYLILGREPHARNAALTFGGAIHQGIEGFLLGESEDQQNQRILHYFTENPAPPDEYRTPQTALEVLKHYRYRCNHDLFEDYNWSICVDAEDTPIIERSFELPLGVLELEIDTMTDDALFQWEERPVTHIHIAWSGRIDLLATCNNRVRVVDHKTTSIVGDQFIQAFQLASQTIGYVWAAKQLWPEHAPSGFCLNAIALKKPGIGQGLMSKGPRGGDPPLSFFRAYFEYSNSRLADWAEDCLTHIEDFIHSLVRGRFPLNDRQCFDKYGRCPYFDVCTIDDTAVRDRLLQSDAFKQVTWNPVAGR